jgi:hypothetical protein
MYDSITEENASQQAVTMTYPGADNALTPAQLYEYEQRLRDTGEFTEEDIKKYLERAQMSMEDIIRKEAADRNAIRRANDDNYDSTIKEIRDALQEFASTPEERLEKYAADKEKSKPRNSVDVDTEGTQLTEEQAEYFKDSKIRDENGNLRVMYHGTQNQFTVFDFSQGGKNGTAEGFGIYLTDNPEVSKSYGDRIIKGYANITKPAYSDRRTIKKSELSKLIRETVSQEAKELAEDYDGDLRAAEKDTWISNYVDTYNQSFSSAISEVTDSIMRMNDNDMDIIQEVMAGMAIRDYSDAVEFYDVLTRVTGYDGIVTNWTSSENGSKSLIALAFRSNQIKNVDNLNPSEDPDIRYSKEIADLRRAVNVSDSTDFTDIIGTAADDVAFGQAASILEQGSELLKGQQVDQQLMRRIARNATRKYGSTYDINQFADNIARVFAYAQNYEVSNQEDLTRIMQEVALPVIEQAKSKDIDDVRKDVRRKMAAYKLDLTDNQRKEVMSAFGSYVAYKNAMKKLGVTISANGSDMDQSWGEMASRLPGILDEFVSEGDQPIVLYDTLSNLQKKVVSNGFGMNNEEAATDLALEIMAAYYEEAGRQQGGNAKQAAALKEQMKRTSELAAQYRRDIQKEYDQKYKEKFSRLKQHYSEEQADKLAKITATNSTEAERRLDAYKAREQKDKIKKDLQKLTTMAEHPNKKKHVPAVAMDAVLDLISAIDFVGPNITRNSNGQYEARVLTPGVNGDRSFQTYVADSYMEVMNKYQEALASGGGSKEQRKWNNSLERIASLYAESAKSYGNGDHIDDFQMTLALKKDLGEALRRVIDKNQGRTSLRSLDSDDLKVIDRVVNNIYTAINNINKSYSMPEEISALGDELIKHGQEAGYDKDRFKFSKTILSFMNDNITPDTFFHALGRTGDKIYKEVMHAQNMKTAFEREDRAFMDGLFKKYGKKNIQKWADDMKTILYEDGTMHLTMGQAMSLLEIVQRPDAQSHLYEGFKAGMIKMNGKEHYDNNAHVLTRQMIRDITNKLTPEQKAISNELQQYMATTGAKRGNERTQQMFGYEMFGDPHYFPMNTDKTTIQTNVQNSSEEGAINGILNAGITKEVQENAHNPLILDNIFDVFLDHMNQINTYAAYAGIIQDINRINNYKQTDSYEKDGEKHGSRSTVKQALKRLFNENDGERYLVQYLKDTNQREMSTKTGAGRIAELSKNFKSASTLGNLRVVIQQPTAWFRAGVMIDPQYMAAGLLPNKAADKMQEESSQISWVKSNGNIDGLSINSQRANVLGLQTRVEKINNAMGWLAGKADDVTWNRLYRAVYAEQKAKYKGDLNSEEFRNKVNDRFDELVSRTQVVDGTLMRSQMMRSTDRLNQSFSAFMAEPTKTFNMFARAYIDAAQEYRKTKKISVNTGKMAARLVTVHLIQLAANAFAQSIADAERDDDEEKDFLTKFLEHFGINANDDAPLSEKALTFAEGNFAEGLNVLVQIPVLSQLNDDFIWPIIKQAIWGESTYTTGTTINEFQGITAVYNALKATVFKSPNSKITPYGQLYKAVNAMSMISGIPASAVMREVVSAWNTVNDLWGGENILKNQPTSKQLSQPVFSSIDDGSDFKAAIEKAAKKGAKYESIENNITEQYKQQYIDLMSQGKTDEASKLENRLMMIYDYLNEREGQKPSSKKRVQKWYTDWLKDNGVESVELTGGTENSGSRMTNMTNVESMDVPISEEPANIWGNAYVTRQPRGTSYWTNGTLDWEKEHHTNAARMIQETFAHGYDPSQPYENDFRRNSEWHMKQINKRNYARKKTYGSGGGNAQITGRQTWLDWFIQGW